MRRLAATTALLLLLLVSVARAEEENLSPTALPTPEAAMRLAEERGWRRTREAQPPVDADVVGAVTRHADGRVGFMPRLQHHMAVEHWFLEGPEIQGLAEAARRAGGRLFARLRGELTLLGVFGGQGLEWYGTGLQHGRDWGPVMGYHERMYRFVVAEVAWTRTRQEQGAVQRTLAGLQKRLKALLGGADYGAAMKLIEEVVETTRDAGFDTKGLERERDYVRRMLVLERDPATWTPADATLVAEALSLDPYVPYKELKKGGRVRLLELMGSWSRDVRDGLAPRAIEGWLALEYQHQRNKALPVLLALDVPATAAFGARLEAAAARLEEAKRRLEALRETDDYAGLLTVVEESAADQALVLDYALAASRTGHWLPAARRLAALKSAMDDPAQRERLLLEQIRETVASGTGLPNSNARPRYNPEVIERFAPKLEPAERERIETVLLEAARSLDPKKDWKQVLLVAELLSGFGEDRAREYYPTLLRRSAGQPSWQRQHLERFAKTLR